MQPLTAQRIHARRAQLQSHGAAPAPQRRDPAPSRAQYRMQRLWLTPLFRVWMRYGVPVLVVGLAVAIYFGSDSRRAAIIAQYDAIRTKIEHRPEFMVKLLEVEGASPSLDAAIREVANIKLPQSSFDLDLEAARARVATLDAVASVELRVKSNTLQIVIAEREPVLVWRRDDKLELLDATGRRVALMTERADRGDLPLIAGEGANLAAAEALEIIQAAGPLLPRLRGLVRMGERRWDLVLDRDQRVLLPSDQPLRALDRLIALDQAENLLERDILAVDLRNKERPVLRLAPYALNELRTAKGLVKAERKL